MAVVACVYVQMEEAAGGGNLTTTGSNCFEKRIMQGERLVPSRSQVWSVKTFEYLVRAFL